MTTSDMTQWQREFGDEYAVPASIAEADGIADLSWHNDVCPSFGNPDDDGGIRLWVEHPDPEQREFPGPRFVVTGECGAEILYHGDDADEALAVLRAVAEIEDVIARLRAAGYDHDAQTMADGFDRDTTVTADAHPLWVEEMPQRIARTRRTAALLAKMRGI